MEPRDGVCTKFERRVRVMAVTIDDWTVSLYLHVEALIEIRQVEEAVPESRKEDFHNMLKHVQLCLSEDEK